MNILRLSRPLSRRVFIMSSTKPYTTSNQNHVDNNNIKKVKEASDESFKKNHELYNQVRPTFHSELVNKFFNDLGLLNSEDKSVLELAVGTGKFTEQIIKHNLEKKHKLWFIEPNEGMLKSFQLNFPGPGYISGTGSSYSLPVDDSSLDVVIVAQGFHWFDDLESLKEINRVLKPNGKLGLIWNFDAINNNTNLLSGKVKLDVDNETLKNAKTFLDVSEFVQEYDFNVPRYRDAKWRNVFESEEGKKLFDSSSAIDEAVHRTVPFPADKVYDYWLSRSYLTIASDEDKNTIKAKIEDIISKASKDSFFDDKNLNQFLGTHYFVVTKR